MRGSMAIKKPKVYQPRGGYCTSMLITLLCNFCVVGVCTLRFTRDSCP